MMCPLQGNLCRYIRFSPVLAFWGGMCCTTFVPPNMMCNRESVCMSKMCSGLRSSTGSCRTTFRSQIHSYQQVNFKCSFLFLSQKVFLASHQLKVAWTESRPLHATWLLISLCLEPGTCGNSGFRGLVYPWHAEFSKGGSASITLAFLSHPLAQKEGIFRVLKCFTLVPPPTSTQPQESRLGNV